MTNRLLRKFNIQLLIQKYRKYSDIVRNQILSLFCHSTTVSHYQIITVVRFHIQVKVYSQWCILHWRVTRMTYLLRYLLAPSLLFLGVVLSQVDAGLVVNGLASLKFVKFNRGFLFPSCQTLSYFVPLPVHFCMSGREFWGTFSFGWCRTAPSSHTFAWKSSCTPRAARRYICKYIIYA